MSIENAASNRGVVLLAELKELVDSFPEDRRKEVINVFRTIFTRLNAGRKTQVILEDEKSQEHTPEYVRDAIVSADSND